MSVDRGSELLFGALFTGTSTRSLDPSVFPPQLAGNLALMIQALILLFVGAMGKSAQMPLHVWLPDAMEGPTPVSALIHAATMVTAGVYMIVRNHAIFDLSPTAMTIVGVIGGLGGGEDLQRGWFAEEHEAFFRGMLGDIDEPTVEYARELLLDHRRPPDQLRPGFGSSFERSLLASTTSWRLSFSSRAIAGRFFDSSSFR